MQRSLRSLLAFAFTLLALQALVTGGCSKPTYSAPDRAAGVRAPRTAACNDDVDPTACLLPWPSSDYEKLDATSPTGLRLSVDLSSLGAADDPTTLDRADGFSRMTPLVTGFDALLDPPADDSVQLWLAEPGRATTGQPVGLRIEAFPSKDDPGRTLLLATPRTVLEPNAEYVVIVTDSLRAKGGGPIAAERSARVSLGLEEPSSQEEADLRGYNAPARALLAKAGVDPSRVLRLWDFTTRSLDDGTRRLKAMHEAARAAVAAGKVTVAIDVVTPGTGDVALVVEGRLQGLPAFAGTSGLTLDAGGLPVASGAREAPFRVAIPAGSGDYPFVMYGHGTGGNFHDSAFDEELAQIGVAKVGISFYGWIDNEVIATFFALKQMISATHRSSAWLMQAVADATAIEAAATGVIADALSAPTLAGAVNPVAGRRPVAKLAMWAGGSLGGTMGLVYSSVDQDIHAAVLNVPGAGWTHFIPDSDLYATIEPFVVGGYGSDFTLLQALFMSQSNWDDVDGAIWKESLAGRGATFLVQESVGDPVLPNIGTANVVMSTGAVEIGKVIAPIPNEPTATAPVSNASAFQQFRVNGGADLDIHGFAAKGTTAGVAAREQIRAFVASVLAGAPKIDVPPSCPNGDCDFLQP